MSPFAGYDMPIQYVDITTEHNAVRNKVGVFDVSHMGEVEITGPDAAKFTNYIFTNDINAIKAGQILYGMMLYPDGGTVDDLLVLKLDLGTSIEERGGDEPIDMMSLMQGQGMPSSLGLNTVVSAIEKAAKDDKVDGIYIECNGVSAAPATLEKVRRALKQFKKSGKWIAAYGHEGINQADYYLASVADSIYLNPVGAVDLHGLGGMTPYMKKLFDKVGIEMQIVRVGTFKSAVEPYMLDDMSHLGDLRARSPC